MIAWFARNHVAANVLMIFILAAGLVSLATIRVEVFQAIDPKVIRVTVPFPGASPEDVEVQICERIENAVEGIEGVKKVSSVSSEGTGSVVAEIEDFADDREVLDDIKTAVEALRDFPPEDALEVRYTDVKTHIQVISIALHGEVPLSTLKELAENIKQDLTTEVSMAPDRPTEGEGLFDKVLRMMRGDREAVTLVNIDGIPPYGISIEISEEALRRYSLKFADVSEAIRRSSLDIPAGTLKTAGGEILVRTKNQAYRAEDFRKITVRSEEDGTEIRLEQVATVNDSFEESDLATYFDGKPAVLLKVFRVGDQGALDVEERIREYVQQTKLPAGVSMDTWFNRADFLRGRLSLLIRNGLLGLALVFLGLTLFLDLRLAFWTTMGIPISFLGAFFLIPMFGASINMITLFALIVVLGIVVDDAIVVGENVFEYRQRGYGPVEAAVKGVREMMAPVTMAILTTIAAFLPLRYIEGFLGKILWVVPVVVVSVLIVSLVEALIILPAHLSTTKPRKKKGPLARLQAKIRGGLQWVVDGPYIKTLKLAVRYRYLTISIGGMLFIVTVGIVAGGHIRFVFMPHMDADNVWAAVTMPQGVRQDDTRQIAARLERAAVQAGREFDEKRGLEEGDPNRFVKHMSTTIGNQPFESMRQGRSRGQASAHLAEINVELLGGEFRPKSEAFTSGAFANRWRELAGDLPGVSTITFNSQFITSGDAINVQLSHASYETLRAAVNVLKERLNKFSGVKDLSDTHETGKRELRVTGLTASGRAAGLTYQEVGRQLREAIYGDEVQRVQRGRDDIEVLVRYTEAERKKVGTLDAMRIRLRDGTEVPLMTVAKVEEKQGSAVINRTNGQRVINVIADVDRKEANANEINTTLRETLLPQLTEEFPGLNYRFEGEQQEQEKSLKSIGLNMAIAMMAIFALLAVQFRSYLQPLIIMSAVPFGLVGAVIGHGVMGLELSMLSGFGVVALTGVVVNDSLIMVDLINRQRREGVELGQVVLNSGTRRFRPILLTTLTTFFGLMPMILERSLQAKFLIPMAVSLGFGVLFATGITLVIVPVLYLILEDLRKIIIGLFGSWIGDDDAEVAKHDE